MVFEIKIKKKALRFLSDLTENKEKVRRSLFSLKDNPVPARTADVAKLKALDNTYRLRIGDIRVVYEVRWNERIILIHRISFRKDAYRGL